MFSTIYTIAVNAQDLADLKFKLGKAFIEPPEGIPPYLTPAAKLAAEGKFKAVDLLGVLWKNFQKWSF